MTTQPITFDTLADCREALRTLGEAPVSEARSINATIAAGKIRRALWQPWARDEALQLAAEFDKVADWR